MGKMMQIQCDCCKRILDPQIDSYSMLTGVDYNYKILNHVEAVSNLYFCPDCMRQITNNIVNCINNIREGKNSK